MGLNFQNAGTMNNTRDTAQEKENPSIIQSFVAGPIWSKTVRVYCTIFLA